jgi:hypothetical protein
MRTLFLIAVFALPAHAAQPPAPSQDDPHVRYVEYDNDDVTVIQVRRGIVTGITLAPDEKIIEDGSARGFPPDCLEPGLEWCVRADTGTNQVLVEPRRGAMRKKIELRTNLRDYSLALHVVPGDNKSRGPGQPAAGAETQLPLSRVIFTYPPRPLATGAASAPLAARETATATVEVPQRAATAGASPYHSSETITIRARSVLFTITLGVGETRFAPSIAFRQALLKAANSATSIDILGATDAAKANAGSKNRQNKRRKGAPVPARQWDRTRQDDHHISRRPRLRCRQRYRRRKGQEPSRRDRHDDTGQRSSAGSKKLTSDESRRASQPARAGCANAIVTALPPRHPAPIAAGRSRHVA